MRDDDWNDYRIVLALHRAGSVSGAARALGVDDTTIVRRLTQTETRLNTTLFERERGRVNATREAQAIMERLSRADAELGSVRDTIAGADRRVEGKVRITAIATIVNRVFLPGLPALLARYPGLDLEFAVDAAVLGIVSRRQADIAVRGARPDSDPEAITRKLGTMAYGVYCHHELLDASPAPRWIRYASEYVGQAQAEWIDARIAEEGVPARLGGNNMEVLLGCLRQGLGKSLLPDALGRRHAELVRLPCDVPTPVREFWMLVHPSVREVQRIKVVAAWAAEAVQVFLDTSDRPPDSAAAACR